MEDKKKIYYWAPFIDNVATVKAVYNSANTLNKYSLGKYEGIILDAFGEWKNSKYFTLNKNIFYQLGLYPFLFKFSSLGFIRSRLKYVLIFILSYFPLKKFLFKEKPQFLIIHLISSLPLFINLLYKFDTKIILRISGKPKLNFFRYYFWKLSLSKIFKITFPTIETLEYFKKLNIVKSDKLELLYDPILKIKEINKLKKEDLDFSIKKNIFYLAIGRLSRQKNFIFLVNCFSEIIKNNKDTKLVIIGTGEDYKEINRIIKRKNLSNNIFLVGYQENVFKFLKNCKAFILSSLWEDPGFVIAEAMISNCVVISSDCPSGPKEIVGDKNGILFKSNSEKDFIEKINYYEKLPLVNKKSLLLNSKKSLKKFTLFYHYKSLLKIICNNEKK